MGSPKWLRQDQIAYIEVRQAALGPGVDFPAGPHYPDDLDLGDGLIAIRIAMPARDDSTIYLRLAAKPDPRAIYAALMGKASAAANIKIKEIAPVFKDAEDIGGIDWRGGSYNPYKALFGLEPSDPNLGSR